MIPLERRPIEHDGRGSAAASHGIGRADAAASHGTGLSGAAAIPIEGTAVRLVERMTASLAVPTATSMRDVSAAILLARRARLNAAIAPRKLSLTHFVAFALAQAIAAHPLMAAFYREIDGRPHRMEPTRIGLGIAVDVEGPAGSRFLVVPVIPDATNLDFTAFAAAYDEMVERARTNRLRVDDLAGGTITLTNVGTVGTTASVPRLLADQGTIVASGAVREIGGERLMTLTSTYDHRIIQGAESGRFLATADDFLQGADGFYEHIFDCLGMPTPPVAGPGRAAAASTSESGAAAASVATAAEGGSARSVDVAAAMGLVRSYRHFGHRAARLDPLGSDPPGDPSLDPAWWGLTDESLAAILAADLHAAVPGKTLADALPELRRTYCGTMAFEFQHIGSHDEREWLRHIIETGDFRARPDATRRRWLLDRLTEVEAFEVFLGRASLGQTRFSIEGLDILVPMLDELLELASRAGIRSVDMGMAHRGRLNILAHVVGVPEREILEEFARDRPAGPAGAAGGGPAEPEADDLRTVGAANDLKYHRGAEGSHPTSAGPIQVRLSPNPSHLEAIDPVLEGRVRATQTDRRGPQPTRDLAAALPLLVHGDAAFAAQGVIAETFNLARLDGYTTGGTIHLIANNQLGFTVEPRDGRSTPYASDLAKGFDVPIVHVNADDPEACLDAIHLAVAFRERFHGDFVIDVVGYRRHGHNEEDDPTYTQPRLYARIAEHPSVRRLYLERLAADGVVEEAPADALLAAAIARLAEIQAAVGELRTDEQGGSPAVAEPRLTVPAPPTAVPADRLRAINEALLRTPDGFTVHPNLVRQLERRRRAVEGSGRIAWAHAEALAFGSLLAEGTPIRLTGQDTQRGTFSQRHLALFDAATGERYAPMEHLPDAQAACEVHDSPLSEFACLGFEYGYAEAAREALVVWEAQYGDFANAAEVIIDQFVIAGLAKWDQASRLTLLLPHGYEGQGPEHSSARLERYLALGADDNMRVVNCTTPAQYFHLLRDQARREPARPLVLMTPKGLLRLPAATSKLDELANGTFHAVLDDPGSVGAPSVDPASIRRLVLCTGRIYYDLALAPARLAAPEVAIGRIELLYPFPAEELAWLVAGYPNLESVAWVQEEPANMGARKFVVPILREVVPPATPIIEVTRPERASPAEGAATAHRAEQARIVAEALGGR